jgi:lysophospholipase L1-like esterase
VVDLHAEFDDGAGGLRPDETTDGVHLTVEGYRRWATVLRGAIASLDTPST